MGDPKVPGVDGKLARCPRRKRRTRAPMWPRQSSHQRSKHIRNWRIPLTFIPTHRPAVGTYRSNDVNAKKAIRVLVTQDLHETVCVVVRLGSRVRNERELADLVLHFLKRTSGHTGPTHHETYVLLKLFFRPSHPRDLRMRVDNRRNTVVVDMHRSAKNSFHRQNAFVLKIEISKSRKRDFTTALINSPLLCVQA